MKYREIVYDLVSDLNQAFDDANIQPYHVLYWVSVVANKFTKQHIDNELKRGSWASGRFLSVFPSVPVLTSPGGEIPKGRKYSALPASLLTFDHDGGIGYVAYRLENSEIPYQLFSRTTAGQVPNLSATFERPTPDNPYYYIVGNNIPYLGIEKIKVDDVEMGLYTAMDPRAVVDLDAECPLAEHLVHQLIMEIANMGRWVLNVPKDVINDGTNDIKVTQGQPLTEQQNEPQ